ncbi:iduronate-sulfatase and sulfatase 1 precursor [Lentisphaera araneosa HTCC2155]|uniref:Iduronate-sulfatase and sulfatase 1 n=1 Tax=Lentisphaera araneosa HTCC2155 TaxID=313628 RepID=A6DMW5_9BACT|nr:sulfatase-like hydrolase/transferase [Lentisphaera araneosa]EDM27001.1 iduronate-sulfatase and sulfatase 1 precursor [Lentisphaera araneosa HTCC2155]
MKNICCTMALAGFSLLLNSTAAAPKDAGASRSPNIIFIITDDHGFNDLEATDLRDEVDMPNIHKLTSNGALMTQAYCTAPQCVPSRAGIVTGRYQQKFGLERNGEGPLPKNQQSIAMRLKKRGYKTGHVGKWHLEPNRKTTKWFEETGCTSMADAPKEAVNAHRPQGFGYDEYAQGSGNTYWSNFDVNGKSLKPQQINYKIYEKRAHTNKFRLQIQTELALNFIERHAPKPDPFFLYLAYYGPHSPLNAPKSLTDQVLSAEALATKGYDNTKKPYTNRSNFARPYTEAEVRQQGLALLKGIDNGVGKIIQQLEKSGELDNTILFFMGDNGAPLSTKSWDGSVNDPWIGSKGIILEGGARIPYFVYWKGVIEAQVFKKAVNTLDAGATAVALAGGDPSKDSMLDGVDLMPFLTGKNQRELNRYIYQRYMNTAAIIDGKYKFMTHENGEELLFDVSLDAPGKHNAAKELHETVNLINKMPEKAAELRKALADWKNDLPVPKYEGGYHDSLLDFIEKQRGAPGTARRR